MILGVSLAPIGVGYWLLAWTAMAFVFLHAVRGQWDWVRYTLIKAVALVSLSAFFLWVGGAL